MWLVPEWAPNPHPIIVHFPIALLVTAVVADLIGLTLRRPSSLTPGASALYMLGVVSLVAAYFTGRDAVGTVFTPGMAHGVVGEHWTWASWTTLYFGGLTVGRLAAHRRLCREHLASWTLFVVAGMGGLLLLTETAERGARLVYEFGVGVIGSP